MSFYLEMPEFEDAFLFRTFFNDGMTIVYPHLHKEIEIIYAQKGCVNIGINDRTMRVEEGAICFFASGEPHYFLASPESERLVFQFDLRIFAELALRQEEEPIFELFRQGANHSQEWSAELTAKVRSLLLEIHLLAQTPVSGQKYQILGDLYKLIGLFYQALPKRNQAASGLGKLELQYQETLGRLNQVFEYIEAHYQEAITLEKAAAYVGFSPYYFTRFFKKNTGKTFINFLTEYRISQAKYILANEKLPMVEVAESAGFASVKTFHHVFKEAVGQSPLQYQKTFAKR